MSNIRKKVLAGVNSPAVSNARSRAGDDEAVRLARARAKRDALMAERRKRDAARTGAPGPAPRVRSQIKPQQ